MSDWEHNVQKMYVLVEMGDVFGKNRDRRELLSLSGMHCVRGHAMGTSPPSRTLRTRGNETRSSPCSAQICSCKKCNKVKIENFIPLRIVANSQRSVFL